MAGELLPGDLVYRPDWFDNAECIRQAIPPDDFFPERGNLERTREALKACIGECSVRAECLELGKHEKEGYFGGISPRGRRAFKKSGLTAEVWLKDKANERYALARRGRPPKSAEAA